MLYCLPSWWCPLKFLEKTLASCATFTSRCPQYSSILLRMQWPSLSRNQLATHSKSCAKASSFESSDCVWFYCVARVDSFDSYHSNCSNLVHLFYQLMPSLLICFVSREPSSLASLSAKQPSVFTKQSYVSEQNERQPHWDHRSC
jgi:hypothetical protein